MVVDVPLWLVVRGLRRGLAGLGVVDVIGDSAAGGEEFEGVLGGEVAATGFVVVDVVTGGEGETVPSRGLGVDLLFGRGQGPGAGCGGVSCLEGLLSSLGSSAARIPAYSLIT